MVCCEMSSVIHSLVSIINSAFLSGQVNGATTSVMATAKASVNWAKVHTLLTEQHFLFVLSCVSLSLSITHSLYQSLTHSISQNTNISTEYLGEWKHNVKSGHGRLTASGNAFVYNGDFKNDAMHGEGKWENVEDGEEMDDMFEYIH